jgi:hypothetical protein
MDIPKLDAARRLLETAVGLYFHEADPISIHTLAAAAHGVLSDISRRTGPGGPEMLDHWIDVAVQPEHRKELRRLSRKAQNFFRHADNDPDDVLKDFNPRTSEILLWDACRAYRSIAGERSPLFTIMDMWARITFAQNWIVAKEGHDIAALADRLLPGGLTRWRSMSRREFFMELAPAAFRAHYQAPRST